MPGIDRQRIVGKEEDELDELTCGICHDIFDEPVVTQCCRQTFCSVCINQWLKDNNTCPNDRKTLDVSGLTEAPRVLFNILSKLKIKCPHSSDGCETILTIEELKSHVETVHCCNSCKTTKKLILDKQQMVDLLQQKLKAKETEVIEISDKLRKLRVTAGNNLQNQKDAIESIRKSSNCKIEYEYHLSEANKNFLMDQTNESFKNFDSFYQIGNDIVEKIKGNEELSHFQWIVMIDFINDKLNPSFLHKGLRISINELVVRIYGFNQVLSQQTEIELARKTIDHYDIIKKSNLSDTLTQLFVTECKIAIQRSSDFSELTKRLAKKFGSLTKFKWTVIAYTSSNSSYFIKCNGKFHVDFGRLKIRAYQYNK